jgi:two-component system, chemotaxis family, CheB/CheR fusion protein
LRNRGPESAAPDPPNADVRAEPSERTPFPVVGIGASAGGLEAFTQLLRALPTDSGMAFVLIQHLDPRHDSKLAEVMSRTTTMPVAAITDRLRVKADGGGRDPRRPLMRAKAIRRGRVA